MVPSYARRFCAKLGLPRALDAHLKAFPQIKGPLICHWVTAECTNTSQMIILGTSGLSPAADIVSAGLKAGGEGVNMKLNLDKKFPISYDNFLACSTFSGYNTQGGLLCSSTQMIGWL